jgi:hypothetical protein
MDGYASKGLRWNNQRCPSGTYFYTIELNDVEYPKPIAGFLYLTRFFTPYLKLVNTI